MNSGFFHWICAFAIVLLAAHFCQPNFALAEEVKEAPGTVAPKESGASRLTFQAERKRLKSLLRSLREVRAEITRLSHEFKVLEKQLQKLDERISQLQERLTQVKRNLRNTGRR